MNSVLKLSSRHNVMASDAARRVRQQRRVECPRSRRQLRYLSEREEWEFFDAVIRARGNRS